MNPVSGEKLPFESISRSQSCRGVRSQEGQSRDWALISLPRLVETVRSMSLPPCGGFRWLVTGKISLWFVGKKRHAFVLRAEPPATGRGLNGKAAVWGGYYVV